MNQLRSSKLICLALAMAALAGCARRYAVTGIVVAVRSTLNEVVVSHKEVEGVMPAMTMPFKTSKPSLAGLYPGARVTFQMRPGRSGIARLKLAPSSLEGLKLEDGESLKLAPPANAVSMQQLVPDFELSDQEGKLTRLSDFKEKTVVVNFIYTRCPMPDVCPRLSAGFAFLQKKLAARIGSELILLSITLDPVYDTPQVLSEYAAKWHADKKAWRLLTGSKELVRQVAGQFGLVYWAEEDSIVHTSATSIINCEGRLVARIEGSSYSVAQLADLVSSVLDHKKGLPCD